MPRFFFDIDDGQRKIIDDDGNNLSGPEAARDRALTLLPSYVQAAPTDDGSRGVLVTVRNERGDVVYTATMTFRSKWLIEP